jgi:hypothetical protein
MKRSSTERKSIEAAVTPRSQHGIGIAGMACSFGGYCRRYSR